MISFLYVAISFDSKLFAEYIQLCSNRPHLIRILHPQLGGKHFCSVNAL
jgi:hypothetical protein